MLPEGVVQGWSYPRDLSQNLFKIPFGDRLTTPPL